MENAKEKGKLDDDLLDQVAGGASGDIPPQRFGVGERVMLRLYPEYGVGIVRNVSLVRGNWQYTVQFDAGRMSADEYEFIPA